MKKKKKNRTKKCFVFPIETPKVFYVFPNSRANAGDLVNEF
jgi:hypothetical protein